jgi:group I intron endonuclease
MNYFLCKDPCIYKITDAATERVYIGSAVQWNRRYAYHLYRLQKNNHHNKTLQAIYNKDPTRLVFCILEKLSDSANILDKEQEYIDLFLSSHKRRFLINHQINVKSALGVKRSAQARENIRKAVLGRKAKDSSKEKMRQAKLGTKLSDATKAKMSASRTGKKINRKTGFYVKSIRLFSDDQIRQMRHMKQSGDSYAQIEKVFNVSRGGLQKIITRQTYNDVV